MLTDFNTATPDFIDGDFKWFIDEYFKNYIITKQAYNLPELKGIACYVVMNESIKDYVLIDSKQNVLAGYPKNSSGVDQMKAIITIMKISKHYDDHEKTNI